MSNTPVINSDILHVKGSLSRYSWCYIIFSPSLKKCIWCPGTERESLRCETWEWASGWYYRLQGKPYKPTILYLLCSPCEIQRKRVGCIVKLEQVSKRSVLLRRKILLSPRFYLVFNFLFIVFLLVLKEQKCNYMHISALKVLENFPYRSGKWQEVLWFVKAVLTTCTWEPQHWCIEGL